MARLYDVGFYILKKEGELSIGTLHRLLYLCQAWYSVWNEGSLLFLEDFEAWSTGPWSRDLFNKTKGVYDIDFPTLKLLFKEEPLELNAMEKECVDKVLFYNYEVCRDGGFGNLRLTTFLYNDLAYKAVRDKYLEEPFESSQVIPVSEVYNFYKTKDIRQFSVFHLMNN